MERYKEIADDLIANSRGGYSIDESEALEAAAAIRKLVDEVKRLRHENAAQEHLLMEFWGSSNEKRRERGGIK